MNPGRVPEMLVFNRQRAVTLHVARLQAFVVAAAERCLGHPGSGEAVLGNLASVEVSVVSDRVIARMHREFLDVPGATDVITFPHGEIVLSATTAERQAIENDEPCDREVARYIVHGLLHLNGHEDADPADSATMWRAQEEILQALWPA